ncbi:sensor domain-containing protein, partial [Streptomyces sp. NPDC088194]|uniref:sensor domain-containing protein n=1 Tax=Streptomyces sp. NPDC088194 TaxID=3154931 RepID=UPI00344F20B9
MDTSPAPRSSATSTSEPLPPARFAFDTVTWKEIANLLLNLFMSLIGFIYVVTTLSLGAGLSVTVIGLPLLAFGLGGCRLLGKLERARVRKLLGVHVEEPRPLRKKTLGGFLPWLWASLKDPVAWRHALYFSIRLPWGIVTFAVTLTSLFVLWPVLPYLARAMSTVDRALARGLLQPSDELEQRIAELESDRGVVFDTASDRGV